MPLRRLCARIPGATAGVSARRKDGVPALSYRVTDVCIDVCTDVCTVILDVY